jgi:hypothetical protein
MTRPMWNRAQDPGQLLRYVEAGTVAALLPGVPPRSDGTGLGVLARVEALYAAFADAGIRYADEPVDSGDGWQRIRGPEEVLRSGRLANCVDLAVTFAGGCLDAGVHPLILVLDQVARGPAHAIVVVWLADGWPGAGGAPGYREFTPDTTASALVWPGDLRQEPGGPGTFLPIDVARVTGTAASFEEAVRSGARLLASEAWHTSITLDVGLNYAKQGEFTSAPRRFTGIRTHSEEVVSLEGLQRNLLDSELPFVPPTDPDAVTAPRKLLERLAQDTGLPGILLIGAAGVGKTRTCFEVAAQAVRDGWAVMHVSDSDAAVTSADLHEAILAERADRVLIVLDYINYYHRNLGLTTLRHHVLRDLARRNTKVALVAACRPGWHATTDADLDQVFEMIELEPDQAQTSIVRDRILRTVAPNATTDVGLPDMRKVCGDRPVIAMLIASEVERLHGRGTLDKALTGIRPADLLGWLKRRLSEDDLLPQRPKSRFTDDDSEPSRALQACLAMLLATPQPESGLLEAGRALTGADRLLGELRAMKWMVASPAGLVPAHDLVTDQLVEAILLEPVGDVVRPAVTDRVLDASLTAGRTVGRFAMNLSRIVRDMPPSKGVALDAQCTDWMVSRADRMGEVLARSEDGAYALGAVLDNHAWSAVAFTMWGQVVGPWLQRFPESISARHLLYKGLRSEIGRTDERLVSESLSWLDVHDTSPEAHFVLARLLICDIDDEAVRKTLAHARKWLIEHAGTVGAYHVLQAMFSHDLNADDAGATAGFTLTWLQFHERTPPARNLVYNLLSRDLDADVAAKAVDRALGWLEEHGATPEAEYVLGRLLPMKLDDPIRQAVVDRSLEWIAVNGVGSNFVSKFVSRQNVLTEPVASAFVQWALENPDHEDVSWRLARVAKGLNHWPHLAPHLLDAMEEVMVRLTADQPVVNSQSEMDGLMRYLCKARSLSPGVIGARLDDLLLSWLCHPESLSPNCSVDSHFLELVSRATSLFVVPRRVNGQHAEILDRLETWIGHWRWHGPERDLARTYVAHARTFVH